jgi:hypothetical protein
MMQRVEIATVEGTIGVGSICVVYEWEKHSVVDIREKDNPVEITFPNSLQRAGL